MHSISTGPTGSRADTTGEVAPSLKSIQTHSGSTGIYILLYEIPSDTHVWSYVFMCGTSGRYFWTYILEIPSGHTFWKYILAYQYVVAFSSRLSGTPICLGILVQIKERRVSSTMSSCMMMLFLSLYSSRLDI